MPHGPIGWSSCVTASSSTTPVSHRPSICCSNASGDPACAAGARCLRIARRDALRARGRSALIVAMIALPVLGLTATDVVLRSGQLDRAEVAARELGQTQARLSFAWRDSRAGAESPTAVSCRAGAQSGPPSAALPTGYRIIESSGTRGAGADRAPAAHRVP